MSATLHAEEDQAGIVIDLADDGDASSAGIVAKQLRIWIIHHVRRSQNFGFCIYQRIRVGTYRSLELSASIIIEERLRRVVIQVVF